MPGSVSFGAPGEPIATIKRFMASSSADGYRILHNHPAGAADPSTADSCSPRYVGVDHNFRAPKNQLEAEEHVMDNPNLNHCRSGVRIASTNRIEPTHGSQWP